jgi:hypothetical protein
MSKNKPLPVDPLHQQQSGALGIDRGDDPIEKRKDDTFKRPANDKALGESTKKN